MYPPGCPPCRYLVRIYNLDQAGAKATQAKEVLLYKPGEAVDVTKDGANYVKSIAPGLQGGWRAPRRRGRGRAQPGCGLQGRRRRRRRPGSRDGVPGACSGAPCFLVPPQYPHAAGTAPPCHLQARTSWPS